MSIGTRPYVSAGPATRVAARLAHAITKGAKWATDRLPHFPDPTAECAAHGIRYCLACHRAPSTHTKCHECGVYESTGMHWDTCNNRIR